MRLGRAFESDHVVAALEHADDRQPAAPYARDLGGDPREVLVCQPERRKLVLGMRVEASTEEDGLWLEIAHGGKQYSRPRVTKLGRAAPRR